MGKDAPDPPDPKETASASTGTNVATSVANAYLGNISEYGPDGSTRVEKSGMESMYDPYTGQTYQIPTFSRYTELSDAQKAVKTQNDGASLNLATLGNKLSGTLGEQLTGNFQLGNEAVESRLFDLGSKRLDPAFAKQEEATRTRLLNSGIREGSAAWNSEMGRMGEQKNDAYNQLLLQGRGQASQELLTEDNQRINQISALLNGGQVSQPNFMGANMPTIPTTDTAGIINQDYQNRLGAYQQKQAGLGGLFSGMGSLAGSRIGLSDDDAKKNKERHGDVEDGMGLWTFNYKGEPAGTPKHTGLMASEVQKVRPSAVKRGKDGLRRVDYGKAMGLMGAG